MNSYYQNLNKYPCISIICRTVSKVCGSSLQVGFTGRGDGHQLAAHLFQGNGARSQVMPRCITVTAGRVAGLYSARRVFDAMTSMQPTRVYLSGSIKNPGLGWMDGTCARLCTVKYEIRRVAIAAARHENDPRAKVLRQLLTGMTLSRSKLMGQVLRSLVIIRDARSRSPFFSNGSSLRDNLDTPSAVDN